MFRFTIRDVLWLTVVMAVICAWFVHHIAREARINATMKVFVDTTNRAIIRADELLEENERLKAAALK
jgi:sensor c-di-GMP phosphodiesterase-like protein